jgi:polar amino acid transport system substrate-binding protein
MALSPIPEWRSHVHSSPEHTDDLTNDRIVQEQIVERVSTSIGPKVSSCPRWRGCYRSAVHDEVSSAGTRRVGRQFTHRRTALAIAVALAPISACSDAGNAAQTSFEPLDDGILRVATALPAPGFWDGSEPSSVDGGFEWELAQMLAERFGLQLDVVAVPFAQLDAGDLGGADLAIAQITATAERDERVDFSIGYYDTAIGVLAGNGASIADLREARDLRWAVVEGSTEQDFLDEVVMPSIPPLVVADETEASAAVAEGRVDAGLADLATGLVIAGESPELELVAQFVTRQSYAVALPAANPETTANRDAVDTALRALAADGTLDDLAERWLEPRFERSPDGVPVIIARTPRSTP